MKKLFKITLFILIFGNSLIANEKILDYVSVKYLTQDVDGFGEGKAIGINVGKSLNNTPLVLSTEFTTTLSEASKNGNNISINTYGAYVGYFYSAAEDIYIIPNIGLLYESTTTSTKSDSTFGLTYGINLNYVINEKFDVLYDYTIIEDKVTHVGFGIRYRF